MVQAELTITNEQGIHLGPANKIANLADRYDCQIHFKTDYMDVNAKSIINLISGTFRHGDVVQCVCNGPDEEEALAAMKRILSEISENEIYFKRQPLTEEQKKHGSYVDENGNLHVKNLSAFWIPELTTTEKVGHTTYTVTGSYEGKESFLKKLERIVAKNAQQKFEDEGADE